MKKLFMSLIVMAIITIVSNAQAAEVYDQNLYMSGIIGVTLSDSTDLRTDNYSRKIKMRYDAGPMVGFALGIRTKCLRAEMEYTYQNKDIESLKVYGQTFPVTGVDISTTTIMANMYHDFYSDAKIIPYLSIGIGVADMNFDDVDGDNENYTGLAGQIGAGIGIEINKNITIDIKYRYLSILDLDLKEITFDLNTHNILFGIRYNFM